MHGVSMEGNCTLHAPFLEASVCLSLVDGDRFGRVHGWLAARAGCSTVGLAPRQVTEMQDEHKMRLVDGDLSDGRGAGIDNLLYSADAEFSCFADLALVSPGEYYKSGEGSLMQAVMDSRAYTRSQEQIVADCIEQMHKLFPSSRKLNCTWSSVVKLGQSLYREIPGQDQYRPSQKTPISNFFLAGSYTYQDYIDSMEGATKSGIMAADEVLASAEKIAAMPRKASAPEMVTA
jgi:zeta-carotene desaturase